MSSNAEISLILVTESTIKYHMKWSLKRISLLQLEHNTKEDILAKAT